MATSLAIDKNTISSTILYALTLLVPLFSWGQISDTSSLIVFQKTAIQYFTIDPLQNLYTVSPNGLLTKFDSEGNELFTYSNTVSGEIASIDASDPFNILLFFPEQQQLVLLDRTLSTRSVLDLRNTSIGEASAVALAHDNTIWLYDDFESQLLKIDANGQTILQSDNLRLTENIADRASHIFRWRDKILVNFPKKGIAVFSLFTQLEAWWPLNDVLDGQVLAQGFAYRSSKGHFVYLPRPDTIQQITQARLDDCLMTRFQLTSQYLLYKNGVLSVLDLVD